MNREIYIDNLRIFLTILVVLHHLAIAYGAPGGWYYYEAGSGEVTNLLLAMFVATNQSFFMGMFFMVSAYFFASSLHRKSSKIIIKSKLKRLGIPMIVYSVFITQILLYLIINYVESNPMCFIDVYSKANNTFSLGPLWFVCALLIFMSNSLIFKHKIKKLSVKAKSLKTSFVILSAIGLGIISFFVRIYFPIGVTIPIIGFNLAHFSQYIFLFIIGIVASRQNWFNQINYKKSKLALISAQILIFVAFPTVFILGGAMEHGTDQFMGGFTIQSFAFSVWEQLVGVLLIIGLLGLFKQKINNQNMVLKTASRTSYAVYIFHSIILLILSIMLKDFEIESFIKFMILIPISIISCYGISYFLCKIPVIKDII
jgi:fucose 4-O-acetylase-like acetyltransferase